MLSRVSSVRRATPSTRIVRITLDGGEFHYRAGQAARLGEAGQDERVPYSIASSPEETDAAGWLEFLIKIEPSGRWGHKFDRLARGMPIEIDGPFGSFVFPDRPEYRSFLFIAGGTGIAPIRSMIKHASLTGIAARIRLLYSARSREDFAYLPELRGMARRGEIELHVTVTRDVAGGRWRGGRGRIDASLVAPLADGEPSLCFVCGPASMVDAVPRLLEDAGVPRERIRLEDW